MRKVLEREGEERSKRNSERGDECCRESVIWGIEAVLCLALCFLCLNCFESPFLRRKLRYRSLLI